MLVKSDTRKFFTLALPELTTIVKANGWPKEF